MRRGLALLLVAVLAPSAVAAPLAVMGDTGTTANTRANIDAARAAGAAGLVGLGDYAYEDDVAEWKTIFKPLTDGGSYLAVGNHDELADFAALVPDGKPTWSRLVSGARLVALDTSSATTSTSAAFLWARGQLCNAAEPTRVLLVHKPWWLLSGAHHPGTESPAGAAAMSALVRDCGVDLVLAGHEHDYQRWSNDGVWHVVVGTGGQSLYPVLGAPSGTAASCSCYGYLQLTLSATGYSALFSGRNGYTDAFSRTEATGAWEPRAEAFPVKTTGGTTTKSAFEGGKGWNLWANGHVQQPANATLANATLTIRAQGQPAAGAWPVMVVSEGGVETRRFTVGGTLATYVVPLGAVAKGAQVRVAYVNDLKTSTEDRNLLLDTVALAPSPPANATAPPVPPAGNATGNATNVTAVFDATFTNARGNAWWVEANVKTVNGTLAGVDARVNAGTWTPLAKTSWGSWARSMSAPAGSLVTFRARAADGAVDPSAAYPWPP